MPRTDRTLLVGGSDLPGQLLRYACSGGIVTVIYQVRH